MRAEKDNGGFLRVSEDPHLVAKTPLKGRFLSVITRQAIDFIMARPAGLEPATYCLEGSEKMADFRMLQSSRHRFAT
jgi:hypothetical protein